MKKTVSRKLKLSRETLIDLASVQGGSVSSYTNPPRCEFSGRQTCATCQLLCTTNGC
jgi:hypothetical protein